MNCPNCQTPILPGTTQCGNCQTTVVPTAEASDIQSPHNPYATPTARAEQALPSNGDHTQGDATGGVIPYKNPKALIAYYLGIVSGLPIIGLPFGVAAFILGILGLKDRSRNPAIKGSAHAWIGIGCGGLFALLWGILLIALIVGAIANA
jgi:hypothetical protein